MLNIQRFATILTALFLAITSCKKDDTGVVQPKVPTLSIADIAQAEGNSNGTMIFKVTLSEASATNVVVNYATLSGTAVGVQDFVSKTDGELLFKAGETEKNIPIVIIGDEIKENDEQFELLLLNPINATLARDRAKGAIQNDDQDNPLNIPATGYTTPATYPNLTKVWGDEFDGGTLNTADWTYEIGNGQGGWGNNELQYYRAENTFLFNGFLLIEAREESFNGSAYTSSRLVTKGKKEFKYGRIDIRAALPEGKGMWPALWMLGGNIDQGGWPACGEIDIMELIGSIPNRVYGTVHYGASVNEHKEKSASKALSGNAKFSDEFHVFSILWEENRIRWYVDDVQFHEVTPAILGAGAPYPFNLDFFFIFNLAVGGNWPGSPDATTAFPQRLIVDYVRVFQ